MLLLISIFHVDVKITSKKQRKTCEFCTAFFKQFLSVHNCASVYSLALYRQVFLVSIFSLTLSWLSSLHKYRDAPLLANKQSPMTSLLHYLTFSFEISSPYTKTIQKSTHAHGFIMLPPRQPRVFTRLARWQSKLVR